MQRYCGKHETTGTGILLKHDLSDAAGHDNAPPAYTTKIFRTSSFQDTISLTIFPYNLKTADKTFRITANIRLLLRIQNQNGRTYCKPAHLTGNTVRATPPRRNIAKRHSGNKTFPYTDSIHRYGTRYPAAKTAGETHATTASHAPERITALKRITGTPYFGNI